MNPIVSISHLDFAYGDQLVLKHVDLMIERGSVVGIIGPNGGGKTTLIKLLIGLLKPTRGAITIDGMSPMQAVRRGDVIGYLPQNPSVTEKFPLNVRQVVRLGLAGKTGMLRSISSEDSQFADFLLERVGMIERAKTPVGQLSGGQMQRVLIARALVCRPKVLLLDEPTTGIDRLGQQQFIAFLQGLRKELGLTVIMVSHDLQTVTSISDRVACLNVTLHYHDAPEHLPEDLVHRLFACDLAAMGIGKEPGPVLRREEEL